MVDIAVIYVWNNNADYNSNWGSNINTGLILGLNRFGSYTHDTYNIQLLEHHTNYIVQGVVGSPLQPYVDVRDEIRSAINVSGYDGVILIFANSTEGFLLNYESPIFMSDSGLIEQAVDNRLTLLEHEISHSFGCKDHVRGLEWKPKYEQCIMGNLYLGEIIYCDECSPRIDCYNYKNYYTSGGPIMATVESQLKAAEGWDYIGGCGIDIPHPVSGSSTPVYVNRNGTWLVYNVFTGHDEVQYFHNGDIITFIASQAFTLKMPGGQRACLFEWNNDIVWVDADAVVPLKASFSVNPSVSSNVGTSIRCTNTSQGDPTSFSWQFGDGSSSTQENPTHVYTVPGYYQIILTVTKDGVSDSSMIQYQAIAVVIETGELIANFTVETTNPMAGLPVYIRDASTAAPGAPIVSWQWNFGDGSLPSAVSSNSHVFENPGSYAVQLTVRDINGQMDSVTKTIVIGGIIAVFDFTIKDNSVYADVGSTGGDVPTPDPPPTPESQSVRIVAITID